MDLSLLRSLLAVAEHGAITEAANALGLSQPALSRRIQQLEESFGTPLLERSRRGVVLNEMGRLVHREGLDIVDRYERLQQSVDVLLRLEAGVVRVGGGATAVAYLMPATISRFQQAHPGVVFQVKEAGSRDIEEDVLADRLELGVVTLPAQSRELEVRPLHRDRIVLVAGDDHPLAGRTRLSASVLAGQAVVGFEGSSAIRQLIDSSLRDAGVEVHVTMELRSIPAIIELAISTQSLAFVSELGLREHDDRLKVLPVRGLRISRQLALIRKRGHPPSPAGRAFEAALVSDYSRGASE